MALGDVVTIINTVETQFEGLQEAFDSLDSTLTEDVVIEIRVDGGTRDVGPALVNFKNPNKLLTLKSGSGVRGLIKGDTWGLWLQTARNMIIEDVDVEALNSIGATRLGSGTTDSLVYRDCKLTGQYAVYAANTNNVTLQDCDFADLRDGVVRFDNSNNINIEDCTYSFISPNNIDVSIFDFSVCDYVTIEGINFGDQTFLKRAINVTDCGRVHINRCYFGDSISTAENIAIKSYITNNFYSSEYMTIENCVFERTTTSIELQGSKHNIIRNNVFKYVDFLDNKRVIYCSKNYKSGDTNYPESISLRNNIFEAQQGAGSASKIIFYLLGLNQETGVTADYDTAYNSFYADVSVNYTYNAVSDSGTKTYSSLTAAQGGNKELNSVEEIAPQLDVDYSILGTALGRNTGYYYNDLWYDYNGNIRPITTPDMGAVDNDSVTYSDEIIAVDFTGYNKTVDEIESGSTFAIAKNDEIYLIPEFTSRAKAHTYNWVLTPTSGTTLHIIGKYAYIDEQEQEEYDVTVTATNNASSDSEQKIDYLIVEKPRPIANFELQSSTSPIKVLDVINFVDKSENGETWLWEIETAPNLGIFDTNTNQNFTDYFTTEGQYTVKLTVTNSDTLTGTRSNTLSLVKCINIVDEIKYPLLDSIDVTEIMREGDSQVFSATIQSANTIEEYEWRCYGADVEKHYTATPTVTYSNKGKFDLALKVTDSQGNSNWFYERRLITVTNDLTGRTTHTVDLSTLETYSVYDPVNGKDRQKVIDADDTSLFPSGVAAGDLIQLRNAVADNYGLIMLNFQGTDGNEIIISNYPGEVAEINYSSNAGAWRFNEGLRTERCKFIVFDFKNGNLANDFYGLRIEDIEDITVWPVDGGVRLKKFTTNVELFGINIISSGFPAYQCHTDFNQTNVDDPEWDGFEFNNLIIHHIKTDSCQGEGFYLGYNNTNINDDYAPGARPHEMKNGLIYRNYIQNTQKDGFQYGNGSGVWEIHNNHFQNVATLNEPAQRSIMSLNTARVDCSLFVYNNTGDLFPANAIEVRVARYTYIFNNKFSNNYSSGRNMYVHNEGDEDCYTFYLLNNTFEGLGDSIYFNMSKDNVVGGDKVKIQNFYSHNNIHIVADDEEISAEAGNLDDLTEYNDNYMYGYYGQDLTSGIQNRSSTNNFFMGQSNKYLFRFNNNTTGDYHINTGSLAGSAGTYVNTPIYDKLGLPDSDTDGYLRPNSTGLYGVGAYEVIENNGTLDPDNPGGTIVPPISTTLGIEQDPCAMSVGGIVEIGFLEFDTGVVWVFNENGNITGALNVQLEFKTIETVRNKSSLKTTLQIKNAGRYYDQELSVNINILRQDVRNLLTEQTPKRYFMTILDESGRKWLLGQTHGLRMSKIEEISGDNVHGYQIAFGGINLFEINEVTF